MPKNQPPGLLASLTAALSERLRDAGVNATILLLVSLLGLTVWIVCIAGLVSLVAPLWGLAGALFFVAMLVAVIALVLLLILKRRTRAQQARAALRQAEARRRGQDTLITVLPELLRNRSGALVVVSGLAIGALIVAAMHPQDGDR
jgi:MFS family permease